MIGTYDYFLFTNDIGWLGSIYSKYLSSMSYITAKIDTTGLLNVTGTEDWGRINQGGHNTEANMMLYRVLTTGSKLANWHGDIASAASWAKLAAKLKTAVNHNNYDFAVGYV